MKLITLTQLVSAVALAVSSMSASAMVIDFKSNDWSGANNLNSFSFGGVTLTACISLQSSAFTELTCTPVTLFGVTRPILQWSNTKGIGVLTIQNDGEVGFLETLKVTFAVATDVLGFTLKGFNANEDVTGNERFRAAVGSFDSTGTTFTADGTNPFVASYYRQGVTDFFLSGQKLGSEAAIDTLTVPVPSTLPLIALGLCAVAGLRGRIGHQSEAR